MGYSTLIDILGAMIIGGLMLLSIQTLNENASSALSNYSSDLIAQQNLTSLVEVLDYDFSRIGYCENVDSILNPSDMIIAADSTSITFWTDLGQSQSNFRGDGIKEMLTYELGPLVNETPNPNDRLLYRYKVGSVKDASNLGVTDFKIHYFDNMKNELTHPIDTKLISFMQIDLKIEDCYGYDTDNPDKTYLEKFPTVFWRQLKMATKNMNR
ncbi:MAG: hypothetical protein KDC52_01295 [Ignavibacteriae bacterium]|nr:hypothetical protein [Ignavibacteriota bacterium]MCB9249819.1 hypothetical protein [Ignavibacteriales bacterium]